MLAGSPPNAECPGCGGSTACRWGFNRDRQRFRCGCCRRTWTDESGTAPRGVRKRAAWLRHLEAMFAGYSVRRAAAELGVTPRTVCRWRHRLLHRMEAQPVAPLGGHVEVLVSGRVHGRTLQLVATADASGREAMVLLPATARAAEVEDMLRRRIEPGSAVVLSQPCLLRRSAEALGYVVQNGDTPQARRHAHALKRWLRRFRGVGRPAAYLAWFAALRATPDRNAFVGRWASAARRTCGSGLAALSGSC